MSSLNRVNKLNLRTISEDDLYDNYPNFLITADKIDMHVNRNGKISKRFIRNEHIEKFAYTENEAFNIGYDIIYTLSKDNRLVELVKDENGNLIHVVYWVISKSVINGVDEGHQYPDIETLDSVNNKYDDSNVCYLYNALIDGYKATHLDVA